MLDFSWSHILIVLVVALVVVGPKDLPRMMHMVGRWAGKARGMANEFKKSFDDMARQEELDKLRQEIEALRNIKLPPEIHEAISDAQLPPADAEPRSGEFQVTETEAPRAPEPALAERGSEPPPP